MSVKDCRIRSDKHVVQRQPLSATILASLVGAALVFGVTSAAAAGGAVTYTGTVKIANSDIPNAVPVAMPLSIISILSPSTSRIALT